MSNNNDSASENDPLVLSDAGSKNKANKGGIDQESSGGSYFSKRHLNAEQKQARTSTFWFTFANILKSMVGIALLVIPQNFAMYGFYTGALAIVIVFTINSCSTYLVIKARNVFKR